MRAVAEDTGSVKRTRGRPKGSKNKPKQKKTGRPKGSKSSYTVSEKALAQRRSHTILPARNPEEFEYNTRLINHIMRISEIAAQSDRKDLNSLKSCFINYLKLCQEDGFPVQNMAAYSAMGFYSAQHFEMFSRKDDPEVRQFTASVRSVCGMFREGMITDGKLNPVIGIFWQRNFDGLRNDTEQIQSIQEQEETTGNGSYKEKYRKLIGGE